MATSKPTVDTAPKRAPIRPRTSPSTVPTVLSMRKPETTNTIRNPNSSSPLSPSAIKRSTSSLSKPAATSTSHAKSPKPKKNPSPVITPSKNKVQGIKSNKEGVQSTKTPSLKTKAPASITRSTSSIRTSNKIANTSVPNRGRSPIAGTKTVNKVGGTSKPTNKRSPSAGRKSGTKGTLSRVNSLPNLNDEVIEMHGEKEAEVPAEEVKDMNNLEGKDEETELPPVPLVEEEERYELRETSGENEGQIETNAETEEKKDEIEQIEEVPSVPLTAETVTELTIPMPDVTVPDVTVPDAPVAAVPESDVPVSAVPVPAVPVLAVPVTAVTVVAHGKKEVPTSNASIEETRSKLIGERRNKVLALVGAFESVMKDKEKEKEKKGESQTSGQSVQNISQTGQNDESNGKGAEAEDVEA